MANYPKNIIRGSSILMKAQPISTKKNFKNNVITNFQNYPKPLQIPFFFFFVDKNPNSFWH